MVTCPHDSNTEYRQAYRKAADYCASQEHCVSEVRQKLHAWEVPAEWHREIIVQLTNEGFINEKRYAITYAGSKFRLNEWGKIKISAELRMKSLPGEMIQEAIQSIDNEEYNDCLKKLLIEKLNHLGAKTPANKQKAARYAASKGYEPALIFSLLKNI